MSKITLAFSMEQFCNDLLAKCNNVSKTIRDEALADIKADVSNPDGEETRSIICRAATEAFGNVKYAAQRYLTTGRTEDNNNLEKLLTSVVVTIKPETVKVAKDAEDLDSEGNASGYKMCDVDVQVTDGGVLVEAKDVTVSTLGNGSSEIAGEELMWEHSVVDGVTHRYTLYKKKGSYISRDLPFTVTYKGRKYDQVIHFRTVNDASLANEEAESVEHLNYEVVTLVLDIPNYNTAATDTLKSQIHKYTVEYAMMQFLFDLLPEQSERYKDLSGTSYNNVIAALNARENFTMRRPSFI